MARVATVYLLAYNLAQSAAWAAVLAQTVRSLTERPSGDRVYSAAGMTVRELHPQTRLRPSAWASGADPGMELIEFITADLQN